MKIWELASGINIMLSEEENDLLEQLITNDMYQLNEREDVIAQKMVSKNVLNRIDFENSIKYMVNYKKDVWRD